MKLVGVALLVCAVSCLASDPGPAVGHRIDRTYDDGYVLVDSTGNSFDLTWNWGYASASQYFAASDTYHFHTIQITGEVATVLTDIYAAGGVFVAAPYAGDFYGPGPAIPDQPISRSIQTFTVPVLYAHRAGADFVLTSIGSTNVLLETAAMLGTNRLATAWSTITNAPAVSSNKAVFTWPAESAQSFYRVRLVLP